MRSVVNVRNQLVRSTGLKDYEIITFTETWLTKGHFNNEFISCDFRVFRKDRSDSNITAKRGGGVLIAVLNEIDCEEYSTPELNGLEVVCVQFPLSKGKLLVYCSYIQPDSTIETYEAHI